MKNTRFISTLWHRIGFALLSALILTLACSSDKKAGDGSNSILGMSGGNDTGGATTAAGGSAQLGEFGGTPATGGALALTGGMTNGGVGTGGVSAGGQSTGGISAGGQSTGGGGLGTGGVSAGGSPGLACSTINGNCDVLTSCTDNIGAPPTCGACPSGYVGSGATACTPTLTALVLSAGALTPALASDVTVYAATVGLASETITLTPTVPTGATLTINDQAVNSNTPWISPTLTLGVNEITIVVSQLGHPSRSYSLTVTRGMLQDAYLKASTATSKALGNAVALSADGGTLAVGAYQESSNAVGVNGNQADSSAPNSGAVYVFTRSGSTWTQQAYVKASNTDASDNFGIAVALSADGGTLAVGANGEDSNAVGVNGDQSDNSSSGSGAVYVFTRSGSTWSQQAYIKASNTDVSGFGGAVALSSDGGTLAVCGGGAVYVFTRSGNTWTQQAYVKASNADARDSFGNAVALSADGGYLAVGARNDDSNAVGINGNQADNTAPYSGAVYVFTRSGNTWTQQAYLKADATEAYDRFGYALVLSSDGGTLAVGAPFEETGFNDFLTIAANDCPIFGSGAVYVFARSGSAWTQQAYLKASNKGRDDQFGRQVALSADGSAVAVGAWWEDSSATGVNGNQASNNASDSGAVYVFTRSGSAWTQQAYVKASNTNASDQFGSAVALSADGGTLAIGATKESSNATGVNGNQLDNSAYASGAVYVFSVFR